MLLGSTLSWLGLLICCPFTSPWVVPNSLLLGLTVLVTVSPWTVLIAVLNSLLARPINVLMTVSPWTVLLKLLMTVSPWMVLLKLLLTVSPWMVLVVAVDYLSLDGPGYYAQLSLGRACQCAGECLSVDCPVNVLVTISPWMVLSKLLLRLIPLIFLLWFLLILLPGRTLAYQA